jgi:hypothetical protein
MADIKKSKIDTARRAAHDVCRWPGDMLGFALQDAARARKFSVAHVLSFAFRTDFT